jgi:hypothetical protein
MTYSAPAQVAAAPDRQCSLLDRGRSSDSRKLRSLAALALIATVALISACGSKAPAATGTGSAGPNRNATNLDKAVNFSQCMRSNGISNFPDPNASGQLTIDAIANGSGVDTNTPAFQQALTACKDLEPPGFTGTERTAQQQEAGLEFAQCVRDNGVPDFPDPTADGPLVDTNRIPSAATSGGMSLLHAAMQKCRSFAAAAGVTGGK